MIGCLVWLLVLAAVDISVFSLPHQLVYDNHIQNFELVHSSCSHHLQKWSSYLVLHLARTTPVTRRSYSPATRLCVPRPPATLRLSWYTIGWTPGDDDMATRRRGHRCTGVPRAGGGPLGPSLSVQGYMCTDILYWLRACLVPSLFPWPASHQLDFEHAECLSLVDRIFTARLEKADVRLLARNTSHEIKKYLKIIIIILFCSNTILKDLFYLTVTP
jgi:hypothetical protein